ncbi:hypothetical protein EMIT0P258_210052 [Pseudomonas sp. IT-P258]
MSSCARNWISLRVGCNEMVHTIYCGSGGAPLPQGFVLYGNQLGSAPFVITGFGMDTAVIAGLAIGMHATVITGLAIGMNPMVIAGLIMGAAAT